MDSKENSILARIIERLRLNGIYYPPPLHIIEEEMKRTGNILPEQINSRDLVSHQGWDKFIPSEREREYFIDAMEQLISVDKYYNQILELTVATKRKQLQRSDLEEIELLLKDAPQLDMANIASSLLQGRILAKNNKIVYSCFHNDPIWKEIDGSILVRIISEVLIQDIERKSQKLLSHYSDDKKKHDFLKKCVAKTIKHLKTASYLESIRKLIIGDPNLRDEKIEEKLRSHPGMRACYDEKKNPIVLIFNDEGIVCRGLEAKDYFSHISPVIYNPKARSELIERCLFRFGGEKNEVKKYLEKVFGKVISGYVDKDIIILYGPKGFNGKSALFKMLSITFGTELIRPGSEDILIERGKASVGAHKSYLMRTFGAILVYFSNPPKGRINCEDLKRLTDLEDVSAREIYGRQTEARPTAFFAIGLNKIDNIPPDDRAFHKRLRVISFPSEFIDKERKEALGFKGELPVGYYMIDPFFEKNFAEDENAKSSLLNLLIEGYYRYKNEGLTEPIAIKQAKNGLIIGNNPYLAFVSDCIVKTDEQGDEISASDLYNSYVAWCKVMMQEAVSASIFHRQISQCTDLPGSTKSNGKTFRRGYKYNDEMEKIKDEARMIHYDF